jgi:hypothetical protein
MLAWLSLLVLCLLVRPTLKLAKNLPGTNAPAYYRPNVIKLFSVRIYTCLYEARVFVRGRPLQPSLMLVGKGAYPRVENMKGASLRWIRTL